MSIGSDPGAVGISRPARSVRSVSRHRLIVSTVILLAGGQVRAAELPADGEIVVIAQTPLDDVGEGALAFPAQTVSDEQIEAAHAIDLTDYLRRMAGGVFINDVQNNPLQPDINYRGFTASPLLGTPQGLSIYVDGVRVNQPFGDVVSWDLIPKSALRSVSLVPGSNPLFGRNSLGGALSIRTKDGLSDPGYELEASYGSYRRRIFEAQAGGRAGTLDWFASADHFAERGWRDFSPSKAVQLFGKLGWSGPASRLALSASFADTDLNGNGFQEQRLLKADRTSVYTQPDNTRNRAILVNLVGEHSFSDALRLSGNAFYRKIRTRTFNGDINDDALGQDLYQPTASEQEVLLAAGITGFPNMGETQENSPFPRFRCIANALTNDEPNETCNGLINRSETDQHEFGGSAELTFEARLGAMDNRLTLGASYVRGVADFAQTAQFGYLTPERGIVAVTGPGAFADGTQESEDVFDARVDLYGRTTSVSLYGVNSLYLKPQVRIDISARFDRTTVRNRDRITPGGGTGSLDGDHRYNNLNPAIAVAWDPRPTFGLDAAVAQTSRAPSAIELGCADPESPCRLPNALAGDPPLDAVIATTFEAGMHGVARSLTWRIGAFRTDSRDDILFVADDQAGFGYFRNFGRTRRQGIEVDARYTAGSIQLAAHYTFLDATYRSAETVDGSANSANEGPGPGFEGEIDIERGDRIPLVPRHIFKASLIWAVHKAVSINVDMSAVSGSIARGNENGAHEPDGTYYLGRGRTAGYAVFNVGAEFRPSAAATLFVQVNNLFDTHYATAAQLGATGFDATGTFVSRPFAAPVIDGERPLLNSTFFAPGAPRWVQAGVKVRF